jgi:dienelactone hydrolase
MSCSDCVRGAVHTDAGEPKGTTKILHGKTCYVASSPPSSSATSTIIYITDSFGLNLINTKLLADRFAAETGFTVLVPDVIPGGGAPLTLLDAGDRLSKPVPWFDILGQLRRISAWMAVAWLGSRFLLWAAPKKAYPKNILPFVQAVRAELPPESKLGVVGFCWGGWASTNLCKEPGVIGRGERLIDAQFCGHPFSLKAPHMIVDAVMTHKVPFSMAIGDKDKWLHEKTVKQTEAALRQKVGRGDGEGGYNYEIKIYEGCTHGFVVRAKPGNEVETSAAEDARAQAIRWLKKYL